MARPDSPRCMPSTIHHHAHRHFSKAPHGGAESLLGAPVPLEHHDDDNTTAQPLITVELTSPEEAGLGADMIPLCAEGGVDGTVPPALAMDTKKMKQTAAERAGEEKTKQTFLMTSTKLN